MTGIGWVELKPSDPCPIEPIFTADVDNVNSIPADNVVRMFANEHTEPPMLDAAEKSWGNFLRDQAWRDTSDWSVLARKFHYFFENRVLTFPAGLEKVGQIALTRFRVLDSAAAPAR